MRWELQLSHVLLECLDLDLGQTEERAMIFNPQRSLEIRPTVVTSDPANEISPNRTHLPANAGLFA
jgi:hypothetical protein